MAQVRPLSQTGDKDVADSVPLRGKACLGCETVEAANMDANMDSSALGPSQLSEFDILLDFLDTDGNGKVSALELADFVDSLLGTQDHKRPNGSIVLEAVLAAALRHASYDKEAAASAAALGPLPGQGPPPPPPPLKGDSSRWSSSRFEGNGDAVLHTKQPLQQQMPWADRPSPIQQHKPHQQLQQVPMPSSGPVAAVNASLPSTISMKELQQYGKTQFLSMPAVQGCFADLLADTELWIRLTHSCSVMTTTLFRQLLMYSAGRLGKKFQMSVFLKTYAAFNALPLWLPFTRLWRNPKNGTLLLVYLHQLTKIQNQLGSRITSYLPLHATLVVLTMLQFICSYVPLITFIAAKAIPAIGSAGSILGFMHANPLKTQVSLWSSVLPFAVLQFLTSSAALKLSCRDFASLKEQCKAVFMLGDVQTEFEGYRGVTVREVMDNIKTQVDRVVDSSSYRRLTALMPLIFAFALETFRRSVRVFLAGNLVPRERLGTILVAFEVYALVYNMWFAYSESADCTIYLFKLRKISSVFKTLLSKEEALSQSLPWLNNHSPRNLLLWSKLRRYYQCPNCLELRWIEMHLTLVMVAAITFTIILVVTIVQKTLLKFTAENADLQLFVVWVIPAFIYLLFALVSDVIMSASTGTEYHDGIMTLSAEALFIADRLNSAEELSCKYGEMYNKRNCTISTFGVAAADSDDDNNDNKGGASRLPVAHSQLSSASPPAASASACLKAPTELALVRRVNTGSGTGTSMVDEHEGAAGAAKAPGGCDTGEGEDRLSRRLKSGRMGSGGRDLVADSCGGGDAWRPASHFWLSREDRAKLRQCEQVIKSLVTYIQFNAEFITLFGVPIDTHLRNTLFSVSITLVGACVSAFLAIVVKR